MFVHLRLHTEFSVVDGTVRIDDAVATAAGYGQPALAITDLSNLFGAIKFYKATRGAGIKPLLGAEVLLQGMKIASGGTARDKKRAVIAVARKLAVLMVSLWKSGETYERRAVPKQLIVERPEAKLASAVN